MTEEKGESLDSQSSDSWSPQLRRSSAHGKIYRKVPQATSSQVLFFNTLGLKIWLTCFNQISVDLVAILSSLGSTFMAVQNGGVKEGNF